MVQKMTLITLAVLVLAVVSGCQDSTNKVSADQLHWQRTINQAKLQAAQQSIEEGRLMYAQRILKECQRDARPDSHYSERVNQMLAQIQVENNRYAKAGAAINIEEMAY